MSEGIEEAAGKPEAPKYIEHGAKGAITHERAIGTEYEKRKGISACDCTCPTSDAKAFILFEESNDSLLRLCGHHYRQGRDKLIKSAYSILVLAAEDSLAKPKKEDEKEEVLAGASS